MAAFLSNGALYVAAFVSAVASALAVCRQIWTNERRYSEFDKLRKVAPDETLILLHPPLPLVGVSILMERERQEHDSLVNGYRKAMNKDKEAGSKFKQVGPAAAASTRRRSHGAWCPLQLHAAAAPPGLAVGETVI